MVEKMLPLLSDGLRKIVENIRDKHPNCDIANELLLADDLINDYNQIIDWRLLLGKETPIMVVARERIDQLINDEARMLSFRHNAFEISYLPKGKQAIYTDSHTWGRENRQTAKPARLIQKLLNREFKCKEFEDFSNWIKNEIIEAGEFVLVSGRDITKYYYEENYEKQSGTLGNSCMRHAECREYFKVHEDKAKLLICRKNDKILGRAIVWELPEGTFGAIFARSGLATKQGLRPANCVAVIDSDYRGELIVPVHNDTDQPQIIKAGDRIAQLILLPYLSMDFDEVTELKDTIRGDGGFGSTGNS